MNNFQLTPNFNLKEFQCPHCGQVIVDSKLVTLLQKLRDRLGRPLSFTSAYRCSVHNVHVGGAENSYHKKGQAVDIPIWMTGKDPEELVKICFEIGFTGVGLNLKKGFIHVDVRPGLPVRFNY